MKKAAGLCLCLALCLPLACSKKQSDTEIPVESPTPSVPAPEPTAFATLPPRPAAFGPKTEMAFAMPSPTTTPQPLEYEVDDIQGTVLALFSGASAPETVAEGETLQSGDTLITRSGSQATLTLNDVTAVQVSASTTVKVADLEPNATQGFTSRLQLAGGRVLSEVQKLTESHSTFEVEANGVVCGVRGTAFEVTDQDGQVDTDTFHGSVEVRRDKLSQLVAGGEHSSFSVKRRAFLAKRRLNALENKRYGAWGKIYKKARRERAQHREWLRSHPQTPAAQKFLERRKAFEQRRMRWRMGRPHPRPLERPERLKQAPHQRPGTLRGRHPMKRLKTPPHRLKPQSTRPRPAHRMGRLARHPLAKPSAIHHPGGVEQRRHPEQGKDRKKPLRPGTPPRETTPQR